MPVNLEAFLAQRRACRATQRDLFAHLVSIEPSITHQFDPLKSAQVAADRYGNYRIICTMETELKTHRRFTVCANAERVRGKSFNIKVIPRDATSGTFFVVFGDSASDTPILGYRGGIVAALTAVGV